MRNTDWGARLGPSEEEWAVAICRGAPPVARLRDPAFRAEGNSAGAEAARRWVDAICHRSPGLEVELFAVLGLDESDLARAFGRARLAGDERLPVWAECLITAVRALPERQSDAAPGEDSTEVATRAFLGAALRLLDWEALRARHPFLDSQVLVCLARQLATRMLLTCGATLELENATRTDPVWDFCRGAWLERLCGFAGLNFVLGTAIRQWRQNALEILSRAARDLALLRETLFAGRSVGPLVGLEGDLGDRHNDGRSVAVLTFAGGERVVYKPKDSRCSRKFLDLVALVNTAAPSLPLPTPRVLCCEGYSWEEYVGQQEAKTEAEAAHFFRRFGMILRLLQLVEGRDFWIDNLRVQGDVPVFIDFECILHPRLAGIGFQVRPADLDPNLYEESVLPTAAVTQPIVVPGFGKQDFGSLSGAGPRLLPLGMWSGYRDRRNGNIWLKSGHLYWSPDAAWPQPGGAARECRRLPRRSRSRLPRDARGAQRLRSPCARGGGPPGGDRGRARPRPDAQHLGVPRVAAGVARAERPARRKRPGVRVGQRPGNPARVGGRRQRPAAIDRRAIRIDRPSAAGHSGVL